MSASNARKLLIVEDNELLREALTETFKSQDFAVHSAADGIEAVQMLKADQFDAVLSDVQMPNLNGLQLLKVIKIMWPGTAVFLMTGNPEIFFHEKCSALAESVFLKGANVDIIFSAIECFLSDKKQKPMRE